MRMLLSAFRFIVFSNIYVSLCAMTFTCKTTLLLYGNNGDWKVNLLVFFATLFLYCFHRLYHRSKMLPEERGEERHSWGDRNKEVFVFITSVSFISATVLMFFMPLRVWLLLVPVAVLGLGYSLPFIPTAKGWKRLRDISWLKIVWVSLAYGWLTTFIPVAYYNQSGSLLDPNVLCVFARSFLFVFLLVIPFDIRDVQHDAKNGVTSIPVLIGAERTVRVAYVLVFLFAAIVICQYYFYSLHALAAIAMLVSILEAAIVVPLSRKPRPDMFYPLVIETSMIFHWAIILLAVQLY